MTSVTVFIVQVLFCIFFWIITGAARECWLPEMDMEELSYDGYDVINNAKREDNSKVKAAYSQFVDVNGTCGARWESYEKRCTNCAVDKCRARADMVCKAKLPIKPPTCEELKTNASKACLFYANDRSGPCSDLTSKACESHVKNSCVKRAIEMCPLTTTKAPSTEPTCSEIKHNATRYCMFYSNLCQGCKTRVECTTCIIDRCSEKFFERCPVEKPQSKPNCGDIIKDTDYSCNYYNDPFYCSSCTNLSRQAECKQCVDTQCQSRVDEDCRFYQKLFRPKLKDISAHTEDPPALILVEELLVMAAEMAVEEYLELGPVGKLLLEGVSQLLHLPGSDGGITQLIGQLFKFIPWKKEVVGVKHYFTKVIPDLVKDFQIIGNLIFEGMEATIEYMVEAANTFFEHITHFFTRRYKKMITAGEYPPEPTCEQIKQDPVVACSYYKKHGGCAYCDFNPAEDCSGWKSAVENLQASRSAQHWLATATSNRYEVLSVKPVEDRNDCDKVNVEVHLFGKDYRVTVSVREGMQRLGVKIAEAAVMKARELNVTNV